MHRLIVLLVAIGAWSPLVYAENIHETVRRIDEKLHELERIGAGERGPPGIRGPAGPRGSPGPKGPAGPQGPRGLQGAHGPAGPRGPQGLRGLRGAQGLVGARGLTGSRGPQGPRGPAGARGPKGAAGKDAKLEGLGHLSLGNGALQFGLNHGNGQIKVNNQSGEMRIDIRADAADDGSMKIYDRDGKRRVAVSTSPASGHLQFFNASDNPIAYVGEWGNTKTGGAFFSDESGNRRVGLGVRGDGEGYVIVNGKSLHDYAEILDVATRDGIRPGAVVAYDAAAGGIVPASVANARRVVGVISGAGGFRPGMVIGSRSDESQDLPVSMSGVVFVRVSSEAGEIIPGDLLIPSSEAGVGMRASDPNAAAGMVFGKALEPWSGTGEGLVLMLVMHR